MEPQLDFGKEQLCLQKQKLSSKRVDVHAGMPGPLHVAEPGLETAPVSMPHSFVPRTMRKYPFSPLCGEVAAQQAMSGPHCETTLCETHAVHSCYATTQAQATAGGGGQRVHQYGFHELATFQYSVACIRFSEHAQQLEEKR